MHPHRAESRSENREPDRHQPPVCTPSTSYDSGTGCRKSAPGAPPAAKPCAKCAGMPSRRIEQRVAQSRAHPVAISRGDGHNQPHQHHPRTRARDQPAIRSPLEDVMPSGRLLRSSPIRSAILTPPWRTVGPSTNDSRIHRGSNRTQSRALNGRLASPRHPVVSVRRATSCRK